MIEGIRLKKRINIKNMIVVKINILKMIGNMSQVNMIIELAIAINMITVNTVEGLEIIKIIKIWVVRNIRNNNIVVVVAVMAKISIKNRMNTIECWLINKIY